VFGMCKLSVKIGKTIAKRKTSLDLTLKVTIVKGNLYYTTFLSRHVPPEINFKKQKKKK
jgi:hypothetical protein